MIGRRDLLRSVSRVGAGVALGLRPSRAAAEPPPETTTLRLDKRPSICIAPQYVAEDLLRAEGFTGLQYVDTGGSIGLHKALAAGRVDISLHFAGPLVRRVDAGDPIVVLGGAHVGCFELFATDRVRAIRDLKGKTVSVLDIDGSQHVFLSSMLAYVGLDPRKDVHWVTHPFADAARLLGDGKIDGFLGFPPEPQELKARKIGHVVVNSNIDRPWSTYFCCMVVGNRDFVRRHPVATKRAMRALLKAVDVCAAEPERVAGFLVERGYAKHRDYALQALREVPYRQWREYEPEDTIRFYALRLHESGMIKANPKKILADGTDWRFLNELKKELKG